MASSRRGGPRRLGHRARPRDLLHVLQRSPFDRSRRLADGSRASAGVDEPADQVLVRPRLLRSRSPSSAATGGATSTPAAKPGCAPRTRRATASAATGVPGPKPPTRRARGTPRAATTGRTHGYPRTVGEPPEPRSIAGHSSAPRLPSIAPPSDRQDSAALPPSAENDQQHTEQAEARGLPRASPGIRAWPEPADEAAPPAPRAARIA